MLAKSGRSQEKENEARGIRGNRARYCRVLSSDGGDFGLLPVTVRVCSGSHNKVPWVGRLQQQTFVAPSARGCGVQGRGSSRLHVR